MFNLAKIQGCDDVVLTLGPTVDVLYLFYSVLCF